MKIPLSEAILLGSTHYEQDGGEFFRDWKHHKYACALGMAIGAVGKEAQARTPFKLFGQEFQAELMFIKDEWPWLHKFRDCCPADGCGDAYEFSNYAEAIMHLFDHHVAGDADDWTLEQLVDWVKSVEPKEIVNDRAPESTETPVCVGTSY